MSLLNRSGGGGGGGGGTVTDVTATLPLQSSGGATPNIKIQDGTVTGQALTWSGSAWNTVERVVRGLGMQSSAALDFTVAAANTINFNEGATPIGVIRNGSGILGYRYAFQAPSGQGISMQAQNMYILTAGNVDIQSTTAALGHAAATMNWADQNGNLTRQDSVTNTATQYQWAAAQTIATWNFADKASGTGGTLQFMAQTSLSGAGGNLDLRSGGGSTVPGNVTIRAGSQTVLSYTGSSATVTIGPALSATPIGFNASASSSATAGGAGPVPDAEEYMDITFNGSQRRIALFNP
jgi:hypothetical protein